MGEHFANTDEHTDAADLPYVDADGRLIAADIDCLSCGYDLRGAHVQGSCPECGATVASSKLDLRARSENRERLADLATAHLTLVAGGLFLWCFPPLSVVALLVALNILGKRERGWQCERPALRAAALYLAILSAVAGLFAAASLPQFLGAYYCADLPDLRRPAATRAFFVFLPFTLVGTSLCLTGLYLAPIGLRLGANVSSRLLVVFSVAGGVCSLAYVTFAAEFYLGLRFFGPVAQLAVMGSMVSIMMWIAAVAGMSTRIQRLRGRPRGDR